MNKLMIFCLLLALAVPVLAVDDNRVMYAGGTVPALPVGTVGRLDTTSEESLTFEYSGTKVPIPYSEIESFEYSTEVTRHLGVLPAIAVGPRSVGLAAKWSFQTSSFFPPATIC